MFRKNEAGTPKVEQAVARAVTYEVTIADMARRSERRAWWVAFASLLMSLALAGGYYYMLPLKEKVPFLVMADAYTGTATVARLSSNSFRGETITANEAVNRSNVAQYVLARESFDSQVMGLRDWDLVFTMSAESVAATQRQLYSKNNPANPVFVYGKEKAIRIKILSITPLGTEANGSFRGASVRIQRTLLDKRTGATTFLDNKLVTMRFTYRTDIALSEEDRVLNPLAFQVTEYRVDSDYSKGVPTPDEGTLNEQQAREAAAQAVTAANAAAAAQADPNLAPNWDAVNAGQPPAQAYPATAPGVPAGGVAPAGYPPGTYPPGTVPAAPAAPGTMTPGAVQPAPAPSTAAPTGTAQGAIRR